MGMLKTILSPLAGVNPEVLGDVAISLVNSGAVSKADFGALIFGGLQVGDGTNAPVAAGQTAPVAVQAALSPREALNVIYGMFTTHRRRSLAAIAAATGLSEANARSLITGNGDFRISTGRRSGKVYVQPRN